MASSEQYSDETERPSRREESDRYHSDINTTVGTYSQFIKPYSGDRDRDQNINTFLASIEDIAETYQWPMKVVKWIIRSKLVGPALNYFDNNPHIQRTSDFNTIKSVLKRKFGNRPDGTDSLQSFMECKQLTGESTIEYSMRMEKLRGEVNEEETGSEASHISIERMKTTFLNGIHDHLKEHMILCEPKSFDEAVMLAARVENRLKVINKRQSSAMMTGVVTPVHNEKCNTLSRVDQISSDMAEISCTDRITPPNYMTCSKYGHKTNLYPPYSRERESGPRVGEPPLNGWGRKSIQTDNPVDNDLIRKPPLITHLDHPTKRSGNIDLRQTLKYDNSTSDNGQIIDTTKMSLIRMQSNFGGTKLMIAIQVNHRAIEGLMDPASDFSLISTRTLREIKLAKHIYNDSSIEIAGAASGIMHTDSSIDIKFGLDNSRDTYFHTFKVVPDGAILGYKFIIGMDFLLPNRARIDFSEKKLYFDGRLVSLLNIGHRNCPSSELLECRVVQKDLSQPSTNIESTPTAYQKHGYKDNVHKSLKDERESSKYNIWHSVTKQPSSNDR